MILKVCASTAPDLRSSSKCERIDSQFVIDYIPFRCINRPDQDGATVLFTAAAKGNEEVVAALIQAGANMDARDKNGKSPLHMVPFSSLMHPCPIEPCQAIAGNHYILVKYLLEAGANTAGVSMRSIRLWSSSNIRSLHS